MCKQTCAVSTHVVEESTGERERERDEDFKKLAQAVLEADKYKIFRADQQAKLRKR